MNQAAPINVSPDTPLCFSAEVGAIVLKKVSPWRPQEDESGSTEVTPIVVVDGMMFSLRRIPRSLRERLQLGQHERVRVFVRRGKTCIAFESKRKSVFLLQNLIRKLEQGEAEEMQISFIPPLGDGR